MTRASLRALADALAEDIGWTPAPSGVQLVSVPYVVGPDGDAVAMVFGNAAHLASADDRAAFIAASRTAVPLLLDIADAAATDIARCDDCRNPLMLVAWGPDRGWCARHELTGSFLAALEAQP